MGAVIYAFAFIGGITTLMFALGMVRTALTSEPRDYVEEVLEEVTRKRGKRK